MTKPTLNRDDYPSTPAVVHKIIACLQSTAAYDEHIHRKPYVLDPAAGNGGILDAIAKRFEHGYDAKPVLYACEKEVDYATVLEKKGYPVMARDFLTYQPTIQFTHVLMNPPFSLAAKFIIRAWEILGDGGVLVSVLPTSIKKQTNSFEFQAMRLITDYGTIEDLGTPFAKGAERRTDEPCILVTLKKKSSAAKLEFAVENDYADKKYEQIFTAPEMAMMPTGFIAKKLACYNAALKEFATYRASHKKMIALLEEFESDYRKSDGHSRDETILAAAQSKMSDLDSFNAFATHTTEAAWNGILEHPEFQRALTKKAKEMISNFRRSRNRVDFNEANIKAMFQALVAQSGELLNQCIFDAFEGLTQFYFGNRVHVEGWKHNSQWMVSPHCIVPWGVETRWTDSRLHLSSRADDTLLDIDRGLCTLMGLPVGALDVYKCPHCGADDIYVYRDNGGDNHNAMKLDDAGCHKCSGHFKSIQGTVSTLRRDMDAHPGAGTCYSHFFKLRYYKKGTIHLIFRDQEVWRKLNYTASKLRGWLPDGAQPWHIVWKTKPKPKPGAPDPYKHYSPVYGGDKDERASDEFVAEINLKLSAPNAQAGKPKAKPKRAPAQDELALALE